MVNSFLQTGRGLIRTFAIVSLILIALIGSISSYIQSRYLTQQILKRDATVTSEFISSIVSAEDTAVFFDAPEATERNEKLQSFFGHLTVMPDVLASNVFDASGRVMWSSQQGMLGERYGDNDELQEAIKGELVFENGTVGSTEKEEHNFLKENHIGSSFVEFYVPIKTPSQKVVGVVEIYKVPLALQNSINDAQRRLWLATALGSVSLFASLFWIVRRMSTQIDSQHKALAEMSALAMIGETAAAVTHSIRNPLASIRAAAEMALNDNLEGARESAKDIIAETDRLNRWTRELLYFSKLPDGQVTGIDLNSLVTELVNEQEASSPSMGFDAKLESGLPQAAAATEPIRHVVRSLFANVQEATEGKGTIYISTGFGKTKDKIVLVIEDSGPGLSPEQMERAMKPFYTTKISGTGLGLPLARQIMERSGGKLELSAGRKGLRVTLTFPVHA